MGYDRHHAIIVSTFRHEYADAARQHAFDLGLQVTLLSVSYVNAWYTFVVLPDGSKEGWSDSDAGDAYRDQFVEYLKTWVYEDGSTPMKWAEVQYGDEAGDNRVLRSDADISVREVTP